MDEVTLALRYARAGHKLRFYQDFYGRQWVRVYGGWKFWRSRRLRLSNQDVLKLKQSIAKSDRPAA